MFQQLREWFWEDSFWLPPGYKWQDVTNAPMSNIYITPFIAIVLLFIRYIFERYIALNVCILLGIVGAPKKNDGDDASSANVYKSRRYDQAAFVRKATETCWRCFAYFVFFVYGSYVLVGEKWVWADTWHTGYITNQPLTSGLKWYVIIELSFYISLVISQFTDTKRKDFYQQFVHHITTIALITGSYMIGHFYTGCVIMLLHDSSDYWLEAAKLAKYAKRQTACDVIFVIFAVVFYVTRWYCFPFWALRMYAKDNPSLSGPSKFSFGHLLLYLCSVLMLLHYYWGFLIGRMVYRFIATGKVEKDDRSDSEEDDDDDGNAAD